jgi:hypothetical protein
MATKDERELISDVITGLDDALKALEKQTGAVKDVVVRRRIVTRIAEIQNCRDLLATVTE